MIDWSKARAFVHRRTLFCTAAVVEGAHVRLFPIGSLRIFPNGEATYFEILARPVPEGSAISFLAVEWSPLFWLKSFLRGRFSHPPALRLTGSVGVRRDSTDAEKQQFFRRVGWLIKTPGGKALWSRPNRVREVTFHDARAVRLGSMTRHLDGWLRLPACAPDMKRARSPETSRERALD